MQLGTTLPLTLHVQGWMPRIDTRLECEGAEFLVLGQLLIERILAYKTYTNMPGYDLVATNPDRNVSAKIQVKSRWETGASGFPIRNLDADFVVFCQLNRGSRKRIAEVRAPEFYVFPMSVIRKTPRTDGWGKLHTRRIGKLEAYRSNWELIREFLDGTPTRTNRRKKK